MHSVGKCGGELVGVGWGGYGDGGYGGGGDDGDICSDGSGEQENNN